jgi:TerC family integral membrane protein
VALILSTTSVESFRSASFTSRVVIHHSSRSLHADIPITSTTPRPSITSPPLSTSSSTSNTRLYNLVDPEDFPTIEIANPPQEDIYKQAIQRTILWVGLAVAFGSALGIIVDPATSEEFFAGYLVEQSLSVDNLFVFLLLFEYFKVPLSSQDRVLNWGIYGAIVMRALMIGLGAAALEKFHAILLVFAAILVYSSAKTLIPEDEDEEEEDLNDNAIVKFSRNLIDSVDEFDGSNFFTMVDGVKKATPLFICMVSLEISDVVFAVDSIPAVFGVTSVSI